MAKERIRFGVIGHTVLDIFVHGKFLSAVRNHGYMDDAVRIALDAEATAMGFRKITWVKTSCVITCHGGPGAFGIVGTAGK